MKALLLVFAIVVSSCTSIESNSYLSETERVAVVELARKMVLTTPGLVTESEAFSIKSSEPTFNYYFLSKPFAQYFISWSLAQTSSSVVVSGQGNIMELENAKVQRVRDSGT